VKITEVEVNNFNINKIAQSCIDKVFRTTTDKPGFALFDFGKDIDSYQLRELMVGLKTELSKFTDYQFKKKLTYDWLGRFDQQVSTKYHLDNAGDQSFLMLGYEPSRIESELYLADYVKFSNDNKTEPVEYFEMFNPIFKDNETILKPYVTEVKPFHKDTYKIVLINNSNSRQDCETFGVLHMARVENPDLTASRVINSMMLSMVQDCDEIGDERKESEFKKTDIVSK